MVYFANLVSKKIEIFFYLIKLTFCWLCKSMIPYSKKYSWGPHFVLFILSLSEWKFNTRNVHYDGCVFPCKMDRTKITNQLEI